MLRDQAGPSKVYLLERKQIAYRELTRALALPGRPEEAFAAAERTKARSLTDQLQLGNFDIHQGMPPEERKEERRHKDAIGW